MRKLLLVGLMVVSAQGMAAKCVVDGKIVYKNPPCPEGRIPMAEIPMSNVDSAGLRKEAQKVKEKELIRRESEQMLRESYREMARLPGEKGRQAREALQAEGSWTALDEVELEKNRQKRPVLPPVQPIIIHR